MTIKTDDTATLPAADNTVAGEVVSSTAAEADATTTPEVTRELVPVNRELARYDDEAGALVVPTGVAGHVLTFYRDQETLNEQQMHLLAPLGIEADWDPAQVAVFLMQCAAQQLNPWAKQAYLMVIAKKYVHHVGIAGFRTLADRTGLYRGRIGPHFCGPDGVWRDTWLDKTTPPSAARVGILRADFDNPVWQPVMYDEYAPMIEEGVWEDNPYQPGKRRKVTTGRRVPAANWKPANQGGKPAVMLAKCAEAAALRAAFPGRFDGFYEPAETERLRHEEKTAQISQRHEQETEDPARARRRAAFAEAQTEAESAGPPPMFAGLGIPDVAAKALLLAELAEQGVILGKTRTDMTGRWSELRGGAPVTEWPLGDVLKLVHRVRPLVVDKLRQMNRGPEAAQYETAPPVGTPDALFGRPAAIVLDEQVAA